MDKEKEYQETTNKLCEQIEKQLKQISEQEIQPGNVEYLYKLIDIKKDIKEMEGESMYNEYNEYGRRGVRGTGRGRYREGGYNAGGNYREYGRRGVDSRYRGEDMLDDVYEAYREYNESGNYGAGYGSPESMQKIEIMADSLMDFVEHVKNSAKTPEERQLIDRKIKELGQM